MPCDSLENTGQIPTSPTYSIFWSTIHVYENPTMDSLPKFCEQVWYDEYTSSSLRGGYWESNADIHIHTYIVCDFSFCKTLLKREHLFIVSVIYHICFYYLVACYFFFFFSNRCNLHSREPSGFSLFLLLLSETHSRDSKLCLSFSWWTYVFTILLLGHFTILPLNLFYLPHDDDVISF